MTRLRVSGVMVFAGSDRNLAASHRQNFASARGHDDAVTLLACAFASRRPARFDDVLHRRINRQHDIQTVTRLHVSSRNDTAHAARGRPRSRQPSTPASLESKIFNAVQPTMLDA